MPFEYTPYRSPFTGAIADLIGRQGDIAAQRALNEAKARTQAVSGVAQSLGNLAQYRADAPKREMERMRIAEARQQMADAQEARAGKQSLATLLSPDYVEGFQPQGPTQVDASGEAGILPKSPSLVKNIGGVKQLDPDAIQAAMGQLGHGAWFLENRNAIDNLNKSMLDRHVLGQKAIQNAADLYKRAARQSEDTIDNRFKVQAAQTLVDALDNIVPGDQLEAIQKALGVGDTRMIDQFADQYATPDKVELLKTGPGDVITPVNQYGQQVAPAIQGPPAAETTAQYNARVSAARAKIKAGTATPDEQALVKGVDADIAARRPPQSVPLDKEHADLLTKKADGTLTPTETIRLQAIEQTRKFIPQFNVNNRSEPLVRVRYFDPSVGRTVEEYVPKSEAGGQRRIAPLSGTEQNRFDSAATVIDVGQAILDSLKDPKVAEEVGAVMGRVNTVRDFIGNPPPELAGLAGEIESFALANMGVHGMRSKAGADQIVRLLDVHHTPESMAAAVNGLLKFSRSFTGRIGDTNVSDRSDNTFKPGQLPSLNIRIGQTQAATPGASAPVVSAR